MRLHPVIGCSFFLSVLGVLPPVGLMNYATIFMFYPIFRGFLAYLLKLFLNVYIVNADLRVWYNKSFVDTLIFYDYLCIRALRSIE